jgi:hypothetical protein
MMGCLRWHPLLLKSFSHGQKCKMLNPFRQKFCSTKVSDFLRFGCTGKWSFFLLVIPFSQVYTPNARRHLC